MGTRGAWGFIFKGKEKVGYNHFDSYPDGLGASILDFVAKTPIEKMKELAEKIELVDGNSEPTDEQIEECKKWADLGVSNKSLKDWYCLLRQSQGEPQAYLDGLKYMIDSQDFLKDSLFCEWAYIINLDTGVVEVYKGFNKDKMAVGRYAGLQRKEGGEYYGVALLTGDPIEGIQKWTPEQIKATLQEYEKRAYPDGEDE